MARRTSVALAVALAIFAATSASANFMIDPNPGGVALKLSNAKDTNTDIGTVGSNLIDITTVGNADFASGNATIKPAKSSTLTDVTFTPVNGSLFGDFSFRGQLNAAGSVTLTVQDNQGDPSQMFTFTGLPKSADFARLGIVAQSGSGETIKWVSIAGDWKEAKQFAFSGAQGVPPSSIPEPAFYQMGSLLALSGLGVLRMRRKRA